MHATLQLAPARCYDLGVLSELLPAVEAGLVEVLCADKGPPDQACFVSLTPARRSSSR